MMKNSKIAILALALLITIFVADASASKLAKRTCSSSKRGLLGKRNPEKCPCSLAFADFHDVFTGYVVFAQDECGDTTVTGGRFFCVCYICLDSILSF